MRFGSALVLHCIKNVIVFAPERPRSMTIVARLHLSDGDRRPLNSAPIVPLVTTF